MKNHNNVKDIEVQINFSGLEEELRNYLKNKELSCCCIVSIDGDNAIRLVNVSKENESTIEFCFAEFLNYKKHKQNGFYKMIKEEKTIINNNASDIEKYVKNCKDEWYIPVRYKSNIFACIYLNTKENEISINNFNEINNIISKHQLYISQIKQKKLLYKIIIENIILINKAYDEKTLFVAQHSYNVALWATEIARELNYDNDRINDIYLAALMHDIGKIHINSDIVNKKGEYSEVEYEEIKKHVTYGYNICRDLLIAYSDDMPEWILQHHEKWDGTGYPEYLKGEEILREARILKIADALDGMMAFRNYKSQKDINGSIQELKDCRGTDFDPVIVDATTRVLSKRINLKQKGINEIILPANLIINTIKKVTNLNGHVSKTNEETLFVTEKNSIELKNEEIESINLVIERFNTIDEYKVIVHQIESNKFLIDKITTKEDDEAFSLLWKFNAYIIDMNSKELIEITIIKISAQGVTFIFEKDEKVLKNEYYAIAIPFDDGTKASMIGKIVTQININNMIYYRFIFTDIKEDTKAELYRQIFRKQIEIRKALK